MNTQNKIYTSLTKDGNGLAWYTTSYEGEEMAHDVFDPSSMEEMKHNKERAIYEREIFIK